MWESECTTIQYEQYQNSLADKRGAKKQTAAQKKPAAQIETTPKKKAKMSAKKVAADDDDTPEKVKKAKSSGGIPKGKSAGLKASVAKQLMRRPASHGQHGPLLNHGPVIKINGNQRYATSSETSAFFQQLCEENEVPVQTFVVRNDMGCGSTIGPVVAGELGVKTLDLGVPTFAMHSIREMAGSKDAAYLATALTAFYNR